MVTLSFGREGSNLIFPWATSTIITILALDPLTNTSSYLWLRHLYGTTSSKTPLNVSRHFKASLTLTFLRNASYMFHIYIRPRDVTRENTMYSEAIANLKPPTRHSYDVGLSIYSWWRPLVCPWPSLDFDMMVERDHNV